MEVADNGGYTLLPISVESALRAGRLAGEHCHRFDRMIAAQALAGDIPVLSGDSKLDPFGVRRMAEARSGLDMPSRRISSVRRDRRCRAPASRRLRTPVFSFTENTRWRNDFIPCACTIMVGGQE